MEQFLKELVEKNIEFSIKAFLMTKNSLDTDILKSKTEIFFDFIRVGEDGRALVITGNKRSPQGISKTIANFQVLYSSNGDYVVFTTDQLKGYLRKNIKSLKQGLDEKYKYIGYYVEVEELGELNE